MGMPDAYMCEICGIDVHFPGTPAGEADLRNHYENTARHDINMVPTEYNAYKCHHQNCNVYKETVCEIVEHDRSAHTGP
jgi:hypothetical protein